MANQVSLNKLQLAIRECRETNKYNYCIPGYTNAIKKQETKETKATIQKRKKFYEMIRK